jgi:hypothetical protein
VAAFRDTALELLDWRRDTDMPWFRVVQGSPTLQRHRRELYARQALSLAAVLKTEVGGRLGDVGALSAARALMGVMAAAGETFGQRLLSGDNPKSITREIRAEVARAFDLLETGLHTLDE